MTTQLELLEASPLLGQPSTECLLCGGQELEILLDLGRTGLANNLPRPADLSVEKTFPLRLARCGRCTHIQLADRVDPSEMFQNYLYVSSASSTLTRHLSSLAEAILHALPRAGPAISLDIGCNDGTLAACFAKAGFLALGIDPAENLAPVARAKGVHVDVAYFGRDAARRLAATHGLAQVITATNSFPHVPALRDYVEGIATMLHSDGVFVLEAHYLLDLLEQCAFDTIYHEHCHFWRLHPMIELFASHGLEVFDCERLPIHHGQLRVWVQHAGRRPVSARVDEVLARECGAGLDTRTAYVTFAEHAERVRRDLRATLWRLRQEGLRIAGYGAPAKASTLAAWCDLSSADLLWIADKNPLKHGRFTPGTHIPVVPVERIQQERPDVLLILAWNFASEIVAELSGYRDAGGRFLIPVPEVRFV